MNNGKITELLQPMGMELDETTSSWYGTVSGYGMKLERSNDGKIFELVIPVTNGNLPDKQAMNEIAKQTGTVIKATVMEYNVFFLIKKPLTSGAYLENISQTVSSLPSLLRNAGWNSCCEASGRTDNLLFCVIGGQILLLNEEEYGKREVVVKERHFSKSEKGENIVAGIVGAFLGSIIGLIVIVLVGQLGYIAILSGLVMGVCTVKGYSLLGGRLSKKGAVLSLIIMLLMTYAACILDSCVYIIRQNPGDVAYMEEMVKFFADAVFTEPNYRFEFIKLLAFTLIGAVPAIFGAFRDDKMAVTAYKLKDVNNNNGF